MLLCCGESLIDMLPRDTGAGEAAFAAYAGGAVLNTAIAAARLGQKTAMLTGLSRDLFGQILDAHLTENDVDTRLCLRSDRPTTLAFVTLKQGQATYAFYDENTAGRMIAPADLPVSLDGITALFFGGISLAVEPCAETYEALCLREAAHLPIMIDPNIRPSFISDPARYRARLSRMLSVADIIKLSDEDLAWLSADKPEAEAVSDLLAAGAKLVLITKGSDGVTAYFAGGQMTQSVMPAKVVDTVGAGDTFNAGILTGLAEAGYLDKAALAAPLPQDVLKAALDLGVRAAAVTVSRAGANPPRRSEI
ncbi:carbohydrate kinase [Rhodobacteraceae bacterium XHP0102]|nr:carbohydrate kinase [Rhodobacteraceae bacterium XHP0102]